MVTIQDFPAVDSDSIGIFTQKTAIQVLFPGLIPPYIGQELAAEMLDDNAAIYAAAAAGFCNKAVLFGTLDV